MVRALIRRLGVGVIAMVALACSRSHGVPPDEDQEIHLYAGWNLISIQVDGAVPVATFQAAVEATTVSNLVAVWSYEPSGDPGVPGQWKTYQPTQAGYPHDLTSLVPGKGYWVKVGQACTAVLTGPPWTGDIPLVAGWNLVGFPGLHVDASESQELASIFGDNFGRVPQVWMYDTGPQRFIGHDTTAIPAIKELTSVQPATGYWVYALEPFTLSPRPVVALVGDADASPLEAETTFNSGDPRFTGANPGKYVGQQVRFADTEDDPYDLNGNGIIDSAFTQDTLHFPVGVDQRVISIANTGGGTAPWAIYSSLPWLRVDGSNLVWGTVSTESDSVVVTVDRSGMQPGTESGSFTIYAGTNEIPVAVRMEVPTSDGDWKGVATTQRVNGKDINLGAVDLSLNLFMNSSSTSETGFRAVLNRDRSLLFPRDVFMSGVFYAGNDFNLNTTFRMPPGDRNVPPYDSFSNGPGEGDDKDVNGDGYADFSNPFAQEIRREISLLGRRTDPNRMEGTYIEAIAGLLPGDTPIFVEGTFQLQRETFEPTKRSIFNEDDFRTDVIGGSSGQNYREYELDVTDPVNVQGVQLTLNVSFPRPDQLVISLIGPTNTYATPVIVHNRGASLPAGINLALTNFNNASGSGTWTLRVEWDPTGERGYFNGWGLNIEGLATYSVSGTVVGDPSGGTNHGPVSGAQLVLAGAAVPVQTLTGTNGAFSIPSLTEDYYSLSISKPGFQPRNVSFLVADGNLNLSNIVLSAVSLTNATLLAAPFVGADPLHVNLSLLIPASQLDGLGTNVVATWDFGDGTPPISETNSLSDEITQTEADHTYTNPGVYQAAVTLVGSGGSLSRQSQEILSHRSRPDPAGSNLQMVVAGFVGSIGAPYANAGSPLEFSDTTNITYDISNDGQPPFVVAQNSIAQENKRDSAGFDIDREPFLPGATFTYQAGGEDTDFFTQATNNLTANGDGIYTVYVPPTVNGVPRPERFRLYSTMGGAAFGTNAARVGNFILQVGRIEP